MGTKWFCWCLKIHFSTKNLRGILTNYQRICGSKNETLSILFILVLDQLIRQHNAHGDGVECGEFFKMRVLGYADDAVMLDRDTQALTIRLTTLVDAAKHEEDMKFRCPRPSPNTSARGRASVSEAAAAAQTAFKHKCDFCEWRFKSHRDILIHRNNCVHQYNTTDEKFVVEEIVEVFDRIEVRWMLVKFEGYDETEYER